MTQDDINKFIDELKAVCSKREEYDSVERIYSDDGEIIVGALVIHDQVDEGYIFTKYSDKPIYLLDFTRDDFIIAAQTMYSSNLMKSLSHAIAAADASTKIVALDQSEVNETNEELYAIINSAWD